MKYFTLIPFFVSCFHAANAARCSDKCALAIASDSNTATHSSLVADCQSYLGTTYYPTISALHTATMTVVRNNDGPTLVPNTAEEAKYSAHLHSGTPVVTTQIVKSTAPPQYAGELCQQPLLAFHGSFGAYSSACSCAGALGIGADAQIYTKIYTRSEVKVVSRFKIIAIPINQNSPVAYLNLKIDNLPPQGGAIPVNLVNTTEEASVFEFTVDHNLRLYHSQLLAGTEHQFGANQIAGAGSETRYSSLQFGWSPTARLSSLLVPHAFIIDLQAGEVGFQLRTIVNETYSTDLVAVEDFKVLHLPIGTRVRDNEPPTREVREFYRLEAVELE